jgi:5-methylcytosine-specific restriction protein A
MPRRSARACRAPGCVELVRDEGGYCDKHERAKQKRYDAARGSAASRGYGALWRRLRLMVLARSPLCADPFGIHAEAGELVMANEVDHIQSRRDGGQENMSNLQSLCHICHSKKTSAEGRRWG